MSSTSPALNLVARELALDAVLGLYRIGLATHIPGIANTLPDDLSRMWAPDQAKHTFPAQLRGVHETVAPPRDGKFWHSIGKTHRRGRQAANRNKGR